MVLMAHAHAWAKSCPHFADPFILLLILGKVKLFLRKSLGKQAEILHKKGRRFLYYNRHSFAYAQMYIEMSNGAKTVGEGLDPLLQIRQPARKLGRVKTLPYNNILSVIAAPSNRADHPMVLDNHPVKVSPLPAGASLQMFKDNSKTAHWLF